MSIVQQIIEARRDWLHRFDTAPAIVCIGDRAYEQLVYEIGSKPIFNSLKFDLLQNRFQGMNIFITPQEGLSFAYSPLTCPLPNWASRCVTEAFASK